MYFDILYNKLQKGGTDVADVKNGTWTSEICIKNFRQNIGDTIKTEDVLRSDLEPTLQRTRI